MENIKYPKYSTLVNVFEECLNTTPQTKVLRCPFNVLPLLVSTFNYTFIVASQSNIHTVKLTQCILIKCKMKH